MKHVSRVLRRRVPAVPRRTTSSTAPIAGSLGSFRSLAGSGNFRAASVSTAPRGAALGSSTRAFSSFTDEYNKHAEERSAQGIVPKPLDATWVAGTIDILTGKDAGDKQWALDLLTNRVPPGVDEAAYVKASFLTSVVKGEISCDVIDKKHAIKLLGGMQGGYCGATLVEAYFLFCH